MAALKVTRSIEIARPPDVVRAQFGDVAHHAATGVHRGVTFEVIDEDDRRCTYRQVSSVGPLRLTQQLELDRTDDGPLVNRITGGQFTGGTITFTVTPTAADRSSVDAELVAPLPALLRPLAPLLRARVGRQLAAALIEDRTDLETGRFEADAGYSD